MALRGIRYKNILPEMLTILPDFLNIALLVTKRMEYTILFWPPKALYG